MPLSSKSTSGIPEPVDKQPSHLGFPIVGVGASAGGLQAVTRFFENMPSDCGMAFVVILHLSPNHPSSADLIIAQSTKMPVMMVESPVPIAKNHVYVIAPGRYLSMNDGYLQVREQGPRRGSHTAIDLFFRDLADVHKTRAFCLILSGTGADGAVGLSRIKEQGGVTLAQLPSDAEHEGMPISAINTEMVDFILPVAEMPQKILTLWQNAQHIQLPASDDPELMVIALSRGPTGLQGQPFLQDILIKLREGTGHDFKHYKRATVLRRIERRMQVTAQPDLGSYYTYLFNHKQELKALLDDMLIGVTNFFRDRESFDALERDIVPQIFSRHAAAGDEVPELRVWSAGTSTGEEAYSLAMLLNDYKVATASTTSLQIFASDIDDRAITAGRAGLYSTAIVTDLPPARLRQYFIKEDGHYRIRKEIRDLVLFAKHSLLLDPPFSQLDLLVCRNLLIYLDREVQREILQMFHFALNPGGYLFLGSSESIDICDELFSVVDKKNRIFRARTGTVASHRGSSIPRSSYSPMASRPKPLSFEPQQKPSVATVHERARQALAPPSILISQTAEILHIGDGAGRYLRHVAGEVTRNLLTLLAPELRLEMRTALYQAQNTSQPVKTRPVLLEHNGLSFQVSVTAHPLRDDTTDMECMLVVFSETEFEPGSSDTYPRTQSGDQMLRNMERELQQVKLQLQDTIERSEVSGEELKASNEEMQAINEELRSATEELETSKEELQSINEELLTVNHELKIKVEETDQANDYLKNLITSTDMATIFIDRALCIKWFTPRAADIFSLLPMDTGRPLMNITHRLDYETLINDAVQVFETLHSLEREVAGAGGRWYIARLLPYRSASDQIDGVVLTFIDITGRRATEEELRLGEERLRLVTESTRDYAIVVVDDDLKITSWNQGAEAIFGHSKSEAEGRSFDFIFTEEDRAAGIPQQEIDKARLLGRSGDERWHVRKDGSRFYCSGEVTQLRGEGFMGFVKIARDLTHYVQEP